MPRRCTWELARGSAAEASGAGDGLSTEECLDVVAELSALGTEALTLVVPEPASRPDWPLVAAAASAAGLGVRLLTDGQGSAATLGSDASAAGVGRVAVRLAGLGSSHDVLHGAGSFERGADTARRLAAAGLSVEVVLTLHPESLDTLEPFHALCRVVGVDRLTCRLPRPGLEPGPCLDPSDLLDVLARLARLAALPGPVVRVDDSLGYFGPHERALRGRRGTVDYWTGCFAGTRALGITCLGEVIGCLSLPRSLVEGSLRNEPLRAIWARPGAFAYNRSAAAEPLSGHCARCTYGAVCRGGARCMALALTGSFACDPMCSQPVALERASRVMGAPAPEPGSGTIPPGPWASEARSLGDEAGDGTSGSAE